MRFWSFKEPISYEKARSIQLQLVELRVQNLIEDTVLFLEHEPVITRGKGLQFTGSPRPRHMPVPLMLPEGISFSESERGGDLTYHGPGQLVIYPICCLDGKGPTPRHDLGAWIRFLEQSVIEVLNQSYGLQTSTQKNATGVWIQSKKIASLGIAVKKWVNYHGISLNVTNDLQPFYFISPCGFNPEVMTRVSDCEGRIPNSFNEAHWREKLEDSFVLFWSKSLGLESANPQVEQMSGEDAETKLKDLSQHLK